MAGGYTTRDVARLLRLSADQVRSFVRAGLLAAERGPRGGYRFSFQDVVLLRAAKDLVRARIPKRRIRKALAELRRELPAGQALTGLEIGVEGSRIVVRDGGTKWSPESGQMHFAYEVDDLARKAAPVARRQAREAARRGAMSADEWYDLGCEVEAPSPDEAERAYRNALALDPAHADARINLGRLLHERGAHAEAEEQYRKAIVATPDDAVAAFNLGVLLEDLGRDEEAVTAYEVALRIDPKFADAHCNAAAVHERLGHARKALRHLRTYRELR